MSETRLAPFATHWGTYRAEVNEGRVTAIHDHAADPDPADIGAGMLDMVDHPTRIARPMIRRSWLKYGPGGERHLRGAEPFVAVPWDEALDLAARELDRVRKAHGNAAIYGGSYGWASAGRFHHAQSQVHRFLNMIGGYTASVGNYSFAAVNALSPHILGPFREMMLTGATSWNVISGHTKLIIAFGGLARKNAQVNSGGVGRHTLREALNAAKANGAEFVNVSPIRADMMAELGAEWLAPRPNTDTALMLGLAHTLVAEGLHDRAFLASHCTGWEKFEPYLMGAEPKDADWAARITGLDAEDIRALARRMAGTRTLITVAWALQRADHGEQPCWMAVVLAAMLGQIGLPGGGFGIGYSSENGVGNPVRLFPFPSLPQGLNAVTKPIPVARISDALLNPGGAYEFDGEPRTYPDIRLVYWCGGNPFHHHQDLNRLREAIRRPETVIVNEIWWTGMARHADIVFPATTMLERDDLALASWEPTMVAQRQAVEPHADSRCDYDIFTGLAARLGLAERFTEGRSAEEWISHLWDQTRQRAGAQGFELPSLAEFRTREVLDLPPGEREPVLMEEFRADPSANPLTTPSGKIEIFSDRIASFGYEDCPGHPVWIAPREWLGNAAPDQLHLISNQPATRLHSQMDPGRVSRASKIAGREPVTIHPEDAATRGIAAGDLVRLSNRRGACLAGARISEEVMQGVVQLSTGAWYDPAPDGTCKHGNPNVLTYDVGTSRLGQGPAAHTTLIALEKYEGAPPPVTAFDPPEVVEG